MKDKKIIQHLYKALHAAPIDLWDKINSQPVNKLEKHDYITKQEQETPGRLLDRWKPFLTLSTVAAVFVVVLFGWILQYSSVDSVVFLDVNPSVKIVTDKKERAVKLEAINEEARTLVENIDFRGKDLYLVTEELLNVMMAEGYIDATHRYLLVSVINDNLEKGKAQTANLNTVIQGCLAEHHIKAIVLRQSVTGSNTIEEYAGKYNISTGKMTFIRNLILLNPDFGVEELAVLSLEDLVRLSSQTRLDLKRIIDVDGELDEFYQNEDGAGDGGKGDKVPDTGKGDKVPDGSKLIGHEKALGIALDLTGGGEVVEFELEKEDGRFEYEIEVVKDGKKYEIEIDAHTGKVMEFYVKNLN